MKMKNLIEWKIYISKNIFYLERFLYIQCIAICIGYICGANATLKTKYSQIAFNNITYMAHLKLIAWFYISTNDSSWYSINLTLHIYSVYDMMIDS